MCTRRKTLSGYFGDRSVDSTSTPFPNTRTYGSGNGVDLVMPSMDHRVAVEVVNKLDDALLQLVL